MSASLHLGTAAGNHRAIVVAALLATYMQAVNISIPNAAVLHIQGGLSMTDDELMTLAGTRSLLSFYDQAPRAIERIAPADVQAPRIGHFGFFREQFSATLWPGTVDKLHRLAAITAAPAAGVPQTTA